MKLTIQKSSIFANLRFIQLWKLDEKRERGVERKGEREERERERESKRGRGKREGEQNQMIVWSFHSTVSRQHTSKARFFFGYYVRDFSFSLMSLDFHKCSRS